MAATNAKVVLQTERAIPEPPKMGRPSKWTTVFAQIQGRKQPVKVAVFDSRNGAGNLRRRIDRGVIVLPGGRDAWEIVDRVEVDADGTRTGRSELHARWIG